MNKLSKNITYLLSCSSQLKMQIIIKLQTQESQPSRIYQCFVLVCLIREPRIAVWVLCILNLAKWASPPHWRGIYGDEALKVKGVLFKHILGLNLDVTQISKI